ncbi:hypothetical protein EFO81_15515, partial [Lactiplantibacillus plantarum]|uniref:hypothetical protein n=1 Tax=Lactiplantibacillus plantarum TaxID=1590 RepID=UPI0021A64353
LFLFSIISKTGLEKSEDFSRPALFLETYVTASLVCVLPVNLSWMITVHRESVFSVSDIELEKAAQMFIRTHYRMS